MLGEDAWAVRRNPSTGWHAVKHAKRVGQRWVSVERFPTREEAAAFVAGAKWKGVK